MKSALVLGGTMFFGKRLVDRLLEHGVDVTIATRGKAKDRFGDRVNRIIVDREDSNSVREQFKNKSWDVVYDQSCFSPIEAYDICQTLNGKVGKLIFTSSGAVYDFGEKRTEDEFNPYEYVQGPFKRRSEYKGIFGYQEAKRQAEAVYATEANFPVTMVRLPFVVGKDDYTERLKFHVDAILDEQPMIIPDQTKVIDFITSTQTAHFLHWLGEIEYKGPINGSTVDDITIGSFITMIESIVGKKAIIQKEGDKKVSPFVLPDHYSLRSDRASTLGFTFDKTEAILQELISHFAQMHR
ncbi:NAD-dependent epimerase/dehydratase family protein [Alkalihalobacillus sp. LMS39]|uniref:NAD-dependent epimerase/dehydratase family protein n=1 Tax=Alkalihalobacillus sp. LMS39 TaxID=2924032 RepID=UPI001FB54624|nr:NAD-dependent epimerase/dehydratase family protein [Alkalihalobacillus sp. LMS39]UOE92571.1 NAD-dependent epimerase/dehydratase family protein [Alkalihalobacillus sp. LMS39]